jgi:uncharacterized protein (DUF2225 family)
MHIDFEAKIMAVQLTLDADEVKIIANMYRVLANKDMEDGYRHSAMQEYEKAAWYYRAVGETWSADRCDREAKEAKED